MQMPHCKEHPGCRCYEMRVEGIPLHITVYETPGGVIECTVFRRDGVCPSLVQHRIRGVVELLDVLSSISNLRQERVAS